MRMQRDKRKLGSRGQKLRRQTASGLVTTAFSKGTRTGESITRVAQTRENPPDHSPVQRGPKAGVLVPHGEPRVEKDVQGGDVRYLCKMSKTKRCNCSHALFLAAALCMPPPRALKPLRGVRPKVWV